MSRWVSSQRAYNEVNADTQNRANFSEEKIIGAASYGAYKILEDAQRREGRSTAHHFAKGFLEGIVSEEVERIFYEKRMDTRDIEIVQAAARKNIEAMYDQRFWDLDRYDPNNIPPMPTGGRDIGQSFAPQSSSGPRQAWNGGQETYGAPRMSGNESRQSWNEPGEYRTSSTAGSAPRQAWAEPEQSYGAPRMAGGGARQAWNGSGDTYGAPRMSAGGPRQAYSGSGETYRASGVAGSRAGSTFGWN